MSIWTSSRGSRRTGRRANKRPPCKGPGLRPHPVQPSDTQIETLAADFDAGRYGEVLRLGALLSIEFPQASQIFRYVGWAHAALGHLDPAIEALETAHRLDENDVDTLIILGQAQARRGFPERAERSLQSALRINPGDRDALVEMGTVASSLGKTDRAIGYYERAITGSGEDFDAWMGLATCHMHQNQMTDAQAALSRALEIRPSDGRALYLMVQAADGRVDSCTGQTIAGLMSGPSTDLRERAFLEFASARIAIARGSDEAGVGHLIRGNHLIRRQLGYSFHQDEKLFARIRSWFADAAPQTRVILGRQTGPQPIFILGMPRSGTTLLEQMLASHSLVHGAGELEDFRIALEKTGWRAGRPDPHIYASIRQRYLGAIADRTDKPWITDKTPGNFRWVGFILAAIPEARIVHVRRDPMAVCWSNFQQHFDTRGLGFSCDMQDVAKYWHLYDRLMAFWNARYPGRLIEVDYEALTQEPAYHARALVKSLGLDWQDRVLEPHLRKTVARTASSAQVRRKIYHRQLAGMAAVRAVHSADDPDVEGGSRMTWASDCRGTSAIHCHAIGFLI